MYPNTGTMTALPKTMMIDDDGGGSSTFLTDKAKAREKRTTKLATSVEGKGNCDDTIEISIPVGHWRDDACGCFNHGICHPHWWTSFCCPLSKYFVKYFPLFFVYHFSFGVLCVFFM
jgi:hypothetical protein